MKLARAHQHYEAIKREIESFFFSKPYSVAVEPDAQRGLHVIRLRHTQELPIARWALMIGDCVHNMRSAFDYVAWELAGADPEDRQTMFPIFADSERFDNHGRRRLKLLPDRARVIVEKLQPFYQATKTGTDPHQQSLWAIEALDASDKHKLLTVTVTLPRRIAVRFDPPTEADVAIIERFPFEDGAVIAYIFPKIFQPSVRVDVDVTLDVAVDPSLETGERQYVVQGLAQLLGATEMIVDLFDGEFFQPDPKA